MRGKMRGKTCWFGLCAGVVLLTGTAQALVVDWNAEDVALAAGKNRIEVTAGGRFESIDLDNTGGNR